MSALFAPANALLNIIGSCSTHVCTLFVGTQAHECARTHLYTKKSSIKRLGLLDWIYNKQLTNSMRGWISYLLLFRILQHGATINWLYGRECHASAWCFLIFAKMILTFCFCRKKLHTNRVVLCRISGLPVATLWMGGEHRWRIFHAMGGHPPPQTSQQGERSFPTGPSNCKPLGPF